MRRNGNSITQRKSLPELKSLQRRTRARYEIKIYLKKRNFIRARLNGKEKAPAINLFLSITYRVGNEFEDVLKKLRFYLEIWRS